jgi:3-oxoacyl-[acyl-carrier protein] reductase
MDLLLELSRNPVSRSVVRSLRLPLPQPPVLRRDRRPWQERFLDDVTIVVAAAPNPTLLEIIAHTLAPAGARVVRTSENVAPEAFRAPAEAWGEPSSARDEPAERERVHALVLDMSGLETLEQVDALYHCCAPWARSLGNGGRAIVLGRPSAEAPNAEAAAARQALEGFTRSLAKELGRKGATANLLWVQSGAEARVKGPLRFFLSAKSAFVTAQPLTVSSAARENAAASFARALFGKLAVVTGAAQGIGQATAKALAREGAHVVIVDRPDAAAAASRLARELSGSSLSLDIASANATDEFAAFLSERGGADIVVHNAGVTRDKTLGRMSEDQWKLVLDVNLRAAARLTERMIADGLLHDEGRLVFLASVSGIAGNPGQTNYAASKAGLIGYVRALGPRLQAHGITVNAIAPGLIETPMTGRMPVGIREAARRLSALGQGGQPEDVAEAITFLALPSAHGITGRVLRVCGGALVGA